MLGGAANTAVPICHEFGLTNFSSLSYS